MKRIAKFFCIFSICCLFANSACSRADAFFDRLFGPSVPKGFTKVAEYEGADVYLHEHIEKTVISETTTKGIIFKRSETVSVTLYQGTELQVYKADYAKKHNYPSRRAIFNVVANPDERKLITMSSYFIDNDGHRLGGKNYYSGVNDIKWGSVEPVRVGTIGELVYKHMVE